MAGRRSGGFVRRRRACSLRVVALFAFASVLVASDRFEAQDQPKLKFEYTRPDAVAEQPVGRMLLEEVAPPPNERIHSCGRVEIALTKVTYKSELARFSYHLALRRAATSPWEEWHVGRNDVGQFVSAWHHGVKVYITDDQVPDCADFKLPIYCLAGCNANRWWSLSEDAPKKLDVHLGAARFWELLLKKNIPFSATITDASLSLGAPDAWNTEVGLASAPAQEGTLRLVMTPRWTRLQQILLHQDGLQARVTYRAQVTDAITEGVSVSEELSLPVVIKPAWWLLSVPLIVGSLIALLIRRLAWHNVKHATREWALATIVAAVFLLLAYATQTHVEIATYEITPDSIVGVALVGLSTGLAGRRAVDKLYKMLGTQQP
jgi:hypothetical protein